LAQSSIAFCRVGDDAGGADRALQLAVDDDQRAVAAAAFLQLMPSFMTYSAACLISTGRHDFT
jgi:hypothetical protein